MWEGDAAFRVGEWDAASSSRNAWWVGVLVGVGVALGDLVGDGGREWEAVGLRVGAPDLVALPVACGDLVGVTGMHAPHVDAM